MERRIERHVGVPAVHEPRVLKRREMTPAVALDMNISSRVSKDIGYAFR
jgi:hypothetical protein